MSEHDLRVWALWRLESLITDDGAMDASVLLEFVLAIDDDAELLDYVSAFVGGDDAAVFALEFCEHRRRAL